MRSSCSYCIMMFDIVLWIACMSKTGLAGLLLQEITGACGCVGRVCKHESRSACGEKFA